MRRQVGTYHYGMLKCLIGKAANQVIQATPHEFESDRAEVLEGLFEKSNLKIWRFENSKNR